MTLSFTLIALVTIAAAVGAMTMRQLVHCALSLTVAFAGLAAAYLQLDAQFVGFAQVLVYVGAVAILIVFAILLTRGGDPAQPSVFSTTWLAGATVVAAVLSVLVWAINHSAIMKSDVTPKPDVSVRQIGDALMNQFVLPLEVIGLLLTAALIGAVIIAMREDNATRPTPNETNIESEQVRKWESEMCDACPRSLSHFPTFPPARLPDTP